MSTPITVADLIQRLETWAPPQWQESWDNCGWQVEPGVLDQPARVLVCLTPTLAVLEEALALRQQGIAINLILAHHPLIFSPLKSVSKVDPVGQMVYQAITQGIGLYSAHTNFDQVAGGTADTLSQLLHLQNPEPVVPTQPEVGYGRVGNLAPALALGDLLREIQHKLVPPRLIYSPAADLGQPIQRLAVLGGSGASFLGAVAKTGAQAYLTADVKFHQFQEARDRGIVLIDAGHYATERPACAALADWVQAQGADWAALSQQDEDFRQFLGSGFAEDGSSATSVTAAG
ncbi:Nif3-like dinuclear metal center hexameric protein [Leptolyngbya sp. BL0902]|uniref:Nif3-like dinuclear metal center hexameric protein n=1 Tax=Leptolyngbya sp. BL0902 TaxID=1115757 RepID=UPI001936AEBF|nr:Nif3-like dinuclear metal center hexameric protein [Leptolyngbya sp. BL0902]QQE66249.1 Nif3-like dinuclear metal center hexameric protein [Leptolyngbya sp. BL0902]